jgi:hypothetical protein
METMDGHEKTYLLVSIPASILRKGKFPFPEEQIGN